MARAQLAPDTDMRVDKNMKENKCNTHAICISSDSKLPECKCWCAECKDLMKAIEANYYKKIKAVK